MSDTVKATMPNYTQAILDYIQTEFLIESAPETLTIETPLIEQGIVDSLGLFRLISFMESTFDVEFEPTDVMPKNFQTVQAIVDFVQSKLAD